MSKKKKNNEPPSLFDSLDLFADTGTKGKTTDSADSAATSAAAPAKVVAAPAEDAGTDAQERVPPTVPSVPDARPVAPPPGLTGHGPLRELFDFNFRQYSAYVICSRAIPAVEDGLKPVQRRILHSLWEKDDGKYTKVANIVGHAMQYHPHGDASIGDAIVVLANKLWGEGKGYLIDGQGNYGNLYTGMPAAATRTSSAASPTLRGTKCSTPRPRTSCRTTTGASRSPCSCPRRSRSSS